MPRTQAIGTATPPTWAIAAFGLLLLFPLFELPRPGLITTPPWKVELVAALFLLVGLLLSSRLLRTKYAPDGPATLFITLLCSFTAWSGLSLFWAPGSGAAVHHTFVWACYIVIFLIGVMALHSHRGLSPIATLTLLLVSILAVLSILDFVSIVDFTVSEGALRIRWAKYAELLVTILPFVWGLAFVVRGRSKALVTVVGVTGWIAAMLSLSRAAFISGSIGFVVLFASIFVFSSHRHRSRVLKFALIWVVVTVGFQLGSAYLTSIPATTQYISGSADPTRSTATMRIFTWSVTGEMAKSSPLLGVGADNFGVVFNDARKNYVAGHPDDPNNVIGEDYLFERAHNEYLQIAAELGIPGILIFSSAFLVFGVWAARTALSRRGSVSPVFVGSLAGMAAFAVSSLFTSFSFRAFQNGIAFFLMASVALYLGSKRGRKPNGASSSVLALGILSTLGLATFSAMIGMSQVFATIGERQPTSEAAKQNFEKSLLFYPENGSSQLSLASAEARGGNYSKAAEHARGAIANGVGASIAYARLSEYEENAGNFDGAVKAAEEGIAVFPRSIYLRAYLAALLERIGNNARSQVELSKARDIDLKQANGWYALIKLGSKDAYQVSKQDPNTAGPAELLPQNAIVQYLNEDMSP